MKNKKPTFFYIKEPRGFTDSKQKNLSEND